MLLHKSFSGSSQIHNWFMRFKQSVLLLIQQSVKALTSQLQLATPLLMALLSVTAALVSQPQL
jgi:hypothetical protein